VLEAGPVVGRAERYARRTMMRTWMTRAGSLLCTALLTLSAQGQTGEKIVIDGSTGVMPLAAALAKAFAQQQPGVTIELGTGLGTKARLQALMEGKIDLALASHGLDVGDITRQGMAVHEVARVAVVFGVHLSVPLTGLTEQQICDVYAGKLSNWKAAGGPELEIAPRTRPDSEVDAEIVRSGVKCLKDLRMSDAVKLMPRAGDMANDLASTAGAIGMTTMTVVEQSQGKVRALWLNGVAPNADNVERKAYPLVRESFFVVRAPATPALARFMEFVRSPAGHKVISDNGALPVR
jgi:phosphate transport system substrate-binding protein